MLSAAERGNLGLKMRSARLRARAAESPWHHFRGTHMAELMFSIAAALLWLVGFAFDVAAVIVGLWIWNRWPALAMRTTRTD